MKKLFFMFAAVAVLSLTACSSNGKDSDSAKKKSATEQVSNAEDQIVEEAELTAENLEAKMKEVKTPEELKALEEKVAANPKLKAIFDAKKAAIEEQLKNIPAELEGAAKDVKDAAVEKANVEVDKKVQEVQQAASQKIEEGKKAVNDKAEEIINKMK